MKLIEICVGVALAVACKLLAVNGETKFAVTTVYEDSACSGVPTLLTISPDAGCGVSPDDGCQATGNSLFAVSSCTTDYEGFVAAAFGGANPYFINRYYTATGCNNVGYAYAYLADGYCHKYPDTSSGFGSFRARIDISGNLGYIYYLDSACTDGKVGGGGPVFCSFTDCTFMLPLCSYENCGSPPYGFCGYGISVGGPSGPPAVESHTLVATYEDSSCSAPAVSAALTSNVVCIPQTDHFDPVCTSDGGAHSVSDCTTYYSGGWDDLGIIDNAFGSLPFLVVEKYVWCDMVDTVTDVNVYRLDENCYPNAAGDASHKLSLGHSLTVTTYADANCTEVASEVTVKRSMLRYGGGCADEKKFFLANTKPSFSVIAVYEDSTCSGTPSQLTFTPVIWCDPLGAANAPCQSIGGSLFTVSSCTQDYSDFATRAFGDGNRFVIEEAYAMFCENIGFVTAYVVDGRCHTDLDGSTSFQAVLDTDSTLVLRTFFDSACNDGRNTATLTKDQLASPMCLFEGCDAMPRMCSLEDCWWWMCGRKFFLGGLEGPPALGRQTIVTLYEDGSCSSLAIAMTLTTELTCTPQNDHYNPVCTQNGVISSVSDCTQYYVGGWDDIGLIQDAFGGSPHLIVEGYLTGRCGDGNALLDVTVYRLDENCYPDATGTGSHRLMLGYSVTITIFSDANCRNVASITTVDQSMFTTSAAGNCVDNDKKFYVVNAQTSFATRAIYEDSSCSGTPSLITFSPMFACQEWTNSVDTTCHSIGNSLFAMSSCTMDYAAFATTAFGSAPFMIDRYYSAEGCSNIGYVNAFSADGYCHTNPEESSSFSSFRARIADDGSVTFLFFRDTACRDGYHSGGLGNDQLTSSYCMPETCEVMNVMCSRQSCGSPPYGHCGRLITVGERRGSPPMAKLSSITLYEDSSCSSPAVSVMMTNDTACTSLSDRFELSCMTNGEAYYSSECTQYRTGGWDDLGVISNAFGSSPYLVVEKYVWCGMVDIVTDVMVYRLDENCYPNAAGDASHKLTLGRSVTITTYTDAYCMGVASKVTVDRSTILSGGCAADDSKFLVFNAAPTFSVLAVYEDSACSGTPSQLAFVPSVGWHDPPATANASCERIDDFLFAVSSSTYDYKAFAASVFGVGDPYVIEEFYSEPDCSEVWIVAMYFPDGVCHIKPLTYNSASFRATTDTEGALSLSTFKEAECDIIAEDTIALSKDELLSPVCRLETFSPYYSEYLCPLGYCGWWRQWSRRLSIGGFGAGSYAVKSAVVVFNDSSCANDPVQIIAKSQLTCSSEALTCSEVPTTSNGVYQVRACIENLTAFAESKFAASPYLIIYKDGSYCGKEKETVVYKADGTCYYSRADGTSLRVLPGFGDSVSIIKYFSASCLDSDAEIVAVGSKYINTGLCYAGTMKLYGNLTAPSTSTAPPTSVTPSALTPPLMDMDQKTRQEIMFPAWLWEPTPRRIFEDP